MISEVDPSPHFTVAEHWRREKDSWINCKSDTDAACISRLLSYNFSSSSLATTFEQDGKLLLGKCATINLAVNNDKIAINILLIALLLIDPLNLGAIKANTPG